MSDFNKLDQLNMLASQVDPDIIIIKDCKAAIGDFDVY